MLTITHKDLAWIRYVIFFNKDTKDTSTLPRIGICKWDSDLHSVPYVFSPIKIFVKTLVVYPWWHSFKMTFKVTFIDVDDVRVLYRRHDLNLSPDPGQIRLCFYLAFLYSFYRHLREQILQCSFHKFYSAQEKLTNKAFYSSLRENYKWYRCRW